MLSRRRWQSEKRASHKMGKSCLSEATEGTDRCNLLHLGAVFLSNYCSSKVISRLILDTLRLSSVLQENSIDVRTSEWEEFIRLA